MPKLKVTYGVVNEMTAICPKQAQVRVGSYQCQQRCKFFQGRIPENLLKNPKPAAHVNCSYEEVK